MVLGSRYDVAAQSLVLSRKVRTSLNVFPPHNCGGCGSDCGYSRATDNRETQFVFRYIVVMLCPRATLPYNMPLLDLGSVAYPVPDVQPESVTGEAGVRADGAQDA